MSVKSRGRHWERRKKGAVFVFVTVLLYFSTRERFRSVDVKAACHYTGRTQFLATQRGSVVVGWSNTLVPIWEPIGHQSDDDKPLGARCYISGVPL